MGASSSKTVVETKVVNEITKEALSKQVSSMAQQTVAVQNMNLSGIDAKCAFEATQNFKGEMRAVQRIEADEAMNMMNSIVDKIGDQVKQESSRKTGSRDLWFRFEDVRDEKVHQKQNQSEVE